MTMRLRSFPRSHHALFSALLAGTALLTGTVSAANYTLGTGTAPAGDAGTTSSFTNPLTGAAAGWFLNGGGTATAPTAGNTYTVASTATTGNALLRTPATTASYVFPGDTLTINPGGRFLIKSTATAAAPQVLTVNNLVLNGGFMDQAGANGSGFASTVAGNLSITAASALGALPGETLTISSKISGSAALTISGTINAGGDTGTVIFTGTNNTFSGMLTLSGGTLDVRADSGLGTGNVTLTAGTLRLNSGVTNDYIGNSATFSLLAGTTANLGYTGTDLVGSLVLGGTTMGAGIYNAANQPTFFSGTGSITVVPEPSTAAQLALLGLAGAGWLARRRK